MTIMKLGAISFARSNNKTLKEPDEAFLTEVLWSRSWVFPSHHETRAEGREPNVMQWMS